MSYSASILTDRCIPSPPTEADRPHLSRLRTDSVGRRFLRGPISEDKIDSIVDKILKPSGPNRYWSVHRQSDQAFLGQISITPHHDSSDSEISYQFLPKSWGSGFATESVAAVVRHTFGEQQAVYSITRSD